MSGGDRFEQETYWIKRHKRLKDDPRSVGNLGKSLEQNLLAEVRIKGFVAQSARILKPYASVLDIGCGYGRVAGSYCDAGYAYTGIDISPVAIASARENEPRGSYIVGSPLTHAFERKFDLVSVLYVFVHFVADSDWKALISFSASVLRSGGGLLFADQFPEAEHRPAPHVAQRPLSVYADAMAGCELSIDPSFRTQLQDALGADVKLPPFYVARKK